jgi:hypothetical protein
MEDLTSKVNINDMKKRFNEMIKNTREYLQGWELL